VRGLFAPELVPEGWFDETIQPVGWFSQDFLNAAASGDATATGTTLTETLSLIAGAASGVRNATATGQVLQFTTSLTAGTASGVRNATATGATVIELFSFLAGAGSGTAGATANGETLPVSYSLVPGSASGGGTVTRAIGDDGGARERFWRSKAEEWLEERLEAIQRAAGKPQRVRKRLATRIVADIPAFVSEIPDLAPRVDAIAAISERLAVQQPDYAAISAAIERQMALIAAWNLMQRRRRDVEALLILAA